MTEITQLYPEKAKEKFRNRKAREEWFKKYPNAFDENDNEIAKNQPNNHFGEWFVAAGYAENGYTVLVEKYYLPSHPRKTEIIRQYLGAEGLDFLRQKRTEMKAQPPDLFVCKGEEFFFVEVKVDNDKLSSGQKELFPVIEKRFQCKIKILFLKNNK